MIYHIRTFLCKWVGFHWYSKVNRFACGNVSQIRAMKDENKYLVRKCWICWKEMPESRYYFNTGIKQKNVKGEELKIVKK